MSDCGILKKYVALTKTSENVFLLYLCAKTQGCRVGCTIFFKAAFKKHSQIRQGVCVINCLGLLLCRVKKKFRMSIYPFLSFVLPPQCFPWVGIEDA